MLTQTAEGRVRQRRRSYRDHVDDEDIEDGLASVHDRLDNLTRQLERMAHAGLAQAGAGKTAAASARIRTEGMADAIGEDDFIENGPARYRPASCRIDTSCTNAQ